MTITTTQGLLMTLTDAQIMFDDTEPSNVTVWLFGVCIKVCKSREEAQAVIQGIKRVFERYEYLEALSTEEERLIVDHFDNFLNGSMSDTEAKEATSKLFSSLLDEQSSIFSP
jgi:hypothetical protein